MATITLTQSTKNDMATSLYNLLGGGVINLPVHFAISTHMLLDGTRVDEIFRAKNPEDAPDPAGRIKLKDITSYLFIDDVDRDNPVYDKMFFPLRSIPYWYIDKNTLSLNNQLGSVDAPELLIPYGTERPFRDVAFVKRFTEEIDFVTYYYYKIIMFYRHTAYETSAGHTGVIYVKEFSVTF